MKRSAGPGIVKRAAMRRRERAGATQGTAVNISSKGRAEALALADALAAILAWEQSGARASARVVR